MTLRTIRIPTAEIHDAIHDRLSTDLSIPVYDEPPEETPIDYVVIGELDVERNDDKAAGGFDVTPEIEIWSSHRGAKEIHENAASVAQSLTTTPLQLANRFTVWDTRFLSYASRRDLSRTEMPVRIGTLRLVFSVIDDGPI